MSDRAARRLVSQVMSLQAEMQQLSDEQLRAKTGEFMARAAAGEALIRLLPEAFAAMREADLRVLGKLPYENQVFAGVVMHRGDIAAMKTGEGKSLTATLPLYLNALSGRGAILVTVNGYLAQRDAGEFAPAFEFMGLRTAVGVPPAGSPDFTPDQKRDIYAADIVYSTSDKLGFDYLLEHLVGTDSETYLRPFNYVLIDEADAVLLDLAQMPLVISGSPRVQSNLFPLAEACVATLRDGIDYEVDERDRSVSLTPAGISAAERYFRIENLYAPERFRLNRHVQLALRARTQFRELRDYTVRDESLVLLSAVTGRLLEGNKLQGGLHQAIESHEGIPTSVENRAMASITYQSLFHMCAVTGGMTGTARGSERELLRVYGTRVVEIPTHHPVIRVDEADVYVQTSEERDRLVLAHIEELRATGRPILVTTASVSSSAAISRALLERGIEHNLLNALSEAKESEMVREAGRVGAITVATLIAGRGTDVKLTPEARALGGLAIVGTEMLPNRRVEGQVRGRGGRQGDPGSSRLYASLQDELFAEFGSVRQERVTTRRRSAATMGRLLRRAQRASEEQASGARKLSQRFDIAMVRQRELVYAMRDRVLAGPALSADELAALAAGVFAEAAASGAFATPARVQRYVFDNLSLTLPHDVHQMSTDPALARRVAERLFAAALHSVRGALGDDTLVAGFQRIVVLKAIDMAWIEQVDFLEQLKTVVQDRNLAQHVVEHEYRKEAYAAFAEMKLRINRDIVRLLALSRIERAADGGVTIQFA